MDVNKHFKNSIEWMKRAQESGDDDGFASHYDLEKGWQASYPEVTGYIIPTLFNCSKLLQDNELHKRAIRASNWLLSIQNETGSFQGRLIDEKVPTPVVFNTGMIIFGLLAAYENTKNNNFLLSAKKAGDWLSNTQCPDGTWKNFCTLNGDSKHAYHSRVSWALLKLYKITGEEKYFLAAYRNNESVLRNQQQNGWYMYSSLTKDVANKPLLHFTSYTIRGMLESGEMLNCERWSSSAIRASEFLRTKLEDEGALYGRYDDVWNRAAEWECLTGTVQMAIIFLKLYEKTKEKKWLTASDQCVERVISYSPRDNDSRNIVGSVSGSYPIDGSYMANCYLSWATKFLLDFFIIRRGINNGV